MRRMLLSITLLACAACSYSTTELENMWIAPNYTSHPYTKVLAVALVNSEANRRIIEDAMVSRINSKGVYAVPSYQLFPEIRKGQSSEFRTRVSQEGFDGMLTTRLLAQNKEVVYTPGYTSAYPPYYRNYWGYWGGWYDAWSPGYYTQYNVYSLETSFFDLKNNSLVWSGTTQSVDPSSVKELTKSAGDVIVEELRKRGVLTPPADH